METQGLADKYSEHCCLIWGKQVVRHVCLALPSLRGYSEMAPVGSYQGHCLHVKEAKGGGLALQSVTLKLVLLRPA